MLERFTLASSVTLRIPIYIAGTLPSSIRSWTRLQQFCLISSGDLQGGILDRIDSWRGLRRFVFQPQYTIMKGSIPDAISGMSSPQPLNRAPQVRAPTKPQPLLSKEASTPPPPPIVSAPLAPQFKEHLCLSLSLPLCFFEISYVFTSLVFP